MPDKKEILNACYNGSSEMISQLSNAVITFLFNIVMMSLAGEHAENRADLILIPTVNTKAELSEMFEWELRVQAFQNSVAIAMCNRVGCEGEMDFAGEIYETIKCIWTGNVNG